MLMESCKHKEDRILDDDSDTTTTTTTTTSDSNSSTNTTTKTSTTTTSTTTSTNKWLVINHDITIDINDVSVLVSYIDTLKTKVNKHNVLSLKNITINIETINTKKAHTSNDNGSGSGNSSGNGSGNGSGLSLIHI